MSLLNLHLRCQSSCTDPCPGLEVDAKPYQRGNTRGRRDRRQNNWPRDGVRKVSAIHFPSPLADNDLQSPYTAPAALITNTSIGSSTSFLLCRPQSYPPQHLLVVSILGGLEFNATRYRMCILNWMTFR